MVNLPVYMTLARIYFLLEMCPSIFVTMLVVIVLISTPYKRTTLMNHSLVLLSHSCFHKWDICFSGFDSIFLFNISGWVRSSCHRELKLKFQGEIKSGRIGLEQVELLFFFSGFWGNNGHGFRDMWLKLGLSFFFFFPLIVLFCLMLAGNVWTWY